MSEEGVWIHQFINVAVKLYGSKNQVYACSNTSHNTSYNTSHNTSQKYQSVLLLSCVDTPCSHLPLDRRPEQPLLMIHHPWQPLLMLDHIRPSA